MHQQSCFAKLLDVRSYVVAMRSGFHGAPPGAAVLLIIGLVVICMLVLPFWAALDLATTWEFSAQLRFVAAPFVNDAASKAGGVVGMSVAAALATFVLTSFTLLPTFFELVFPSFRHPLLDMTLQASLLFDFITDWPKAYELTAATANPLLHYSYAAITCIIVSVGLQAVLVMCVTGIAYGSLRLIVNRNIVTHEE